MINPQNVDARLAQSMTDDRLLNLIETYAFSPLASELARRFDALISEHAGLQKYAAEMEEEIRLLKSRAAFLETQLTEAERQLDEML